MPGGLIVIHTLAVFLESKFALLVVCESQNMQKRRTWAVPFSFFPLRLFLPPWLTVSEMRDPGSRPGAPFPCSWAFRLERIVGEKMDEGGRDAGQSG
jgi:hypothetical protein